MFLPCLTLSVLRVLCGEFTSALHRHADLLQQFVALLLDHVGEVGQRRAFGKRFANDREPAREAVELREAVERDRFESRVLAAPLRVLPQRLALARQRSGRPRDEAG